LWSPGQANKGLDTQRLWGEALLLLPVDGTSLTQIFYEQRLQLH